MPPPGEPGHDPLVIPRAFAFDVFGTVVDWRMSAARESASRLAALGRADLDPHRFADSWRGRYRPAIWRHRWSDWRPSTVESTAIYFRFRFVPLRFAEAAEMRASLGFPAPK